jgi:hypothetical protein
MPLVPIGISRNIFVDTLHADLNAGAAIGEHFVEVGLQAVVRPCLDCDSDTTCPIVSSKIAHIRPVCRQYYKAI